MEKIMTKMEQYIVPLAKKMSQNRLLNTISSSFTLILPIIIVGSIFSLLVGFNVDGYQTAIVNMNLKPYFALVPKFTTEMLAVYLVFAVGYQFSRHYDMKQEAVTVGIISIVCFFLVTPLALELVDEESVSRLSFDWLGSTGMFSSLTIGILVGLVFKICKKYEIMIKLPNTVPSAIQNSFSALIPAFIVAFMFIGLKAALELTPFENYHMIIYGVFLLPLQGLSNNLFVVGMLLVLMHLFWFFGIHGTMILGPVALAILTSATLANTEAYAANLPLPNILTLGFITIALIGGAGATLSLSIIMLFAKSKQYKTLGKICITPSIFGVNEPIIFGLPIVLNPYLFVPFILVPVLNGLILFFSMKTGFANYPALINLPTGTPLFMDGYLQMGVSGIVMQVVLIVVDIIVYYPFFKIMDNKALERESIQNEL